MPFIDHEPKGTKSVRHQVYSVILRQTCMQSISLTVEMKAVDIREDLCFILIQGMQE